MLTHTLCFKSPPGLQNLGSPRGHSVQTTSPPSRLQLLHPHAAIRQHGPGRSP